MPSCEAAGGSDGEENRSDAVVMFLYAAQAVPRTFGDSGSSGLDGGIPVWPLVGKMLCSQQAPWEAEVDADVEERWAGGGRMLFYNSAFSPLRRVTPALSLPREEGRPGAQSEGSQRAEGGCNWVHENEGSHAGNRL